MPVPLRLPPAVAAALLLLLLCAAPAAGQALDLDLALEAEVAGERDGMPHGWPRRPAKADPAAEEEAAGEGGNAAGREGPAGFADAVLRAAGDPAAHAPVLMTAAVVSCAGLALVGLALLRLSWVVAAADVSGSAAPLLAAAAPVPAEEVLNSPRIAPAAAAVPEVTDSPSLTAAVRGLAQAQGATVDRQQQEDRDVAATAASSAARRASRRKLTADVAIMIPDAEAPAPATTHTA